EGNAAAGHYPLFDRRLSRVHCVLNASLFLLQLGLGSSADLDDCHAADEFRQSLLQLLAIVVRSGVFDLRANLLDATFDVSGLADAFDDRCVVLVDADSLSS